MQPRELKSGEIVQLAPNVRTLAARLASTLVDADENKDLVIQALGIAEDRAGWKTTALRSWLIRYSAERALLLDECRAAGLLPSEE